MKRIIRNAALLALVLALVTEICFCTYAVNDHPDEHSVFVKFAGAFFGPGFWAAYKIFPVLADMDDHITGYEGGFQDNAGTAIMYVTPFLLMSLFYFVLIWLFAIAYRLIATFFKPSPP